MKIYLIQVYKKDQQNNVWSEPLAFTSPRMRDTAFAHLPKDVDAEKQDVQIEKRNYNKTSPQVDQAMGRE